MASLLSIHPRPVLLSPLPRRSRALNPIPLRSRFGFCAEIPSSILRFDSVVARLGPIGEFPDLESFENLSHKLLDRAEGIIYTIADAAFASSSDAAAVEGSKRTGDWLSGITGYLESVLKILKDGLSVLHVPYAYGFAIILLTVIVKAATFPLTKKQVESALAMRSLQPQVKAIQQRYAGDAERIQLETARLYKLAGVNPLAGCLPTLATIPVWIGLYRALSNVADEGLLTEGFFWIPSVAGPTTIASRQSGSGTSRLFPFVDGHPPLGWSETLAYLVLPLLLVGSQYISTQIMQSSQVPSGLSLYWFTNNALSTAQQVWLQKLGGAKNPVQQDGDLPTKDESSNIQNSVSNVEKSVIGIETEKVQTSQGEKADSSGLLPGERFKQLKEEEARRKKQREEEKRKEEEASEERRMKLNMVATDNGTLNSNGSSIMKDGSHEEIQKGEVSDMHASAGDQAAFSSDSSDKRDQET